jgi:hypothetical protein
MRLGPLVIALFCSILFTGCGGGGGGGGTPNVPATPISVSVHWPARTRALEAPPSALSVALILDDASPDGTDFTWVIDRGNDITDHTSTYTSPNAAKIGTAGLSVRFYAQPGGNGSVVATGSATVTILGDGSGIGTVTINNVISTVSIPAAQTISLGEVKDLSFETRESGGAIIAVSPGSAQWAVTAGGDKLRINPNGQAEGLVPGTATVTVTVDGKTSAAQTVTVVSGATISITPSQVAMAINGTRPFTATVGNAPDTSVTWSVQEGAAGGTVDQQGLYTAPAAPGTYHVVATSNFDQSKSATATVAVSTTGVPTVSIDPPSVTMPINGIQNFTATVTGSPDTAVTWSVQEGAAGGSITTGGAYTAPGTAGTYHVVATSVFDPTAKATATVTVQSGGSTVIIR